MRSQLWDASEPLQQSTAIGHTKQVLSSLAVQYKNSYNPFGKQLGDIYQMPSK